MIFFITSFFSISPMHVRWLLPCIVKNNSSVMGLILDQCNGKIKLITHYAVHLELEVLYEKRCSQKFLKIQRKTPVPESLFNKVAGLRLTTFLKKTLWYRCFPVNFAKFLRTPFLENISGHKLGKCYILIQMIETRLRYFTIKPYSDG